MKNKDPKTHFIIVRVTPAEHQIVKENALEQTLNVSDYVRSILKLKWK